MKKYMNTIMVAGLSAVVTLSALVPAQAMPLNIAPPSAENSTNDLVQVQYRRDRGYSRDYGRGYYNGHRGYREYRRGYRQRDGYWFPLAAFGAGAIIGGAIASQPRYVEPEYRPRPVYRPAPVRGSQAHVNWCFGRYRSYDAYSNTFQPYNGPRQQCYSPYS
jgi:hypothetical protein